MFSTQQHPDFGTVDKSGFLHLIQLIKDLFISLCYIVSTVLAAAEAKGREGMLVTLKGLVKFKGKIIHSTLPMSRLTLALLQATFPAASCDIIFRRALHPLCPCLSMEPAILFLLLSHLALPRHGIQTICPPYKTLINLIPTATSLEGLEMYAFALTK